MSVKTRVEVVIEQTLMQWLSEHQVARQEREVKERAAEQKVLELSKARVEDLDHSTLK